MGETRKSTRVRTMLGGQILFNNRSSTIDCKIRNMSEEGAKIIIEDFMAIPQRFEFSVPQKGRTFIAKVIWRHDHEAGLEFIPQAYTQPESSSAATLAERLKELESENANLRKRVIDLKSQIDRYMDSGA